MSDLPASITSRDTEYTYLTVQASQAEGLAVDVSDKKRGEVVSSENRVRGVISPVSRIFGMTLQFSLVRSPLDFISDCYSVATLCLK